MVATYPSLPSAFSPRRPEVNPLTALRRGRAPKGALPIYRLLDAASGRCEGPDLRLDAQCRPGARGFLYL